MWRFWGGNKNKSEPEVFNDVTEGLKRIYKTKLLPLEEAYKFHDFHSPRLGDCDFDAKPMILLIGQYSTGKTTFIRHMLGQDFPGIRIGPEPTTDSFVSVMYGEEDGVLAGNLAVSDPSKHFRALEKFGNAFLKRFNCSMLNNSVLKGITIVDTPGILSGEKQRLDRGYDFPAVLEWFAERVDRIILLFDAHKLDISDEFRQAIEAVKGFDTKVRIVINKADCADHQQLIRIYGALLWSLAKVIKTPEVVKVYIGSFWDRPLQHDENRKLLELEERDLFSDLRTLPKVATLRKMDDLITRARLAKVHAYIIGNLRKEMPWRWMYGWERKKQQMIKELDTIFNRLATEHGISRGDFPDLNRMKEELARHDFQTFQQLNLELISAVDDMLTNDIPKLMKMMQLEDKSPGGNSNVVQGGAFEARPKLEPSLKVTDTPAPPLCRNNKSKI